MADVTALVPRSETPTAVAAPGFMHVSTIDQAIKLADYIQRSQLVPEAYRCKPGDIVIAMQLGMELGLAPLQALQSVAVINGRPALWGDAMKGLVVGLADCEDFVEDEPEGDDPERWVATCTIKRRHRTAVVRRFSWADAKLAGLAGKSGPWKSYPKRMLMLRARGFALRDAFPDRLRGIISAEEAQDFPTPPAPVPSEPRRVGESAPAPAVPPAETVPADSVVAAPVVAPAPAPATTPSPSPTTAGAVDQEEAGLAVVNSEYGKDARGPYYVITTDRGAFHTRDGELYSAAAVLEGTDHRATFRYRIGKRSDGTTARVLTAVTVDAPVVQGELLEAERGDQ